MEVPAEKTIETTPPPAAQTVEQKAGPADLPVRGRFTQYTTPFLQLVLPLLTARYGWLAYEDINPFNLLDKPHPKETAERRKTDFKPWEKPTAKSYLQRNIAAIGLGATLLSIIGFYSKRTYDDMRTLYAEAVGYELDKKPEDVTLKDILSTSNNDAVKVTRGAYIRRTFWRVVAGGAPLMPWHMLRDHKASQPKYDANVNAGIGAMGAYLSLEGFFREPSFFDGEQRLVDTAINHSDVNAPQIIEARNIQSLLILQRKHMNKRYKWPDYNTEDGQNEEALTQRIAELMNQTYNNMPHKEDAHLTIGKFNFLVGFGMLDSYPTSLAFVDLANKSKDMKDVKAAAAAINKGEPAETVFKQFGIELAKPATKTAEPAAATPEPAARKFTATIKPAQEKIPTAARTAQEFAASAGDGSSLSA